MLKKKIICVVDTQSKQERRDLIDYIIEKAILVSVISEVEGFQQIYVREDDVWMAITVIKPEITKKVHLHYSSFEEFKEDYENGNF